MDVALGREARGPCAGIRVVDFSMVVAGPFCTQALGDLGADVVKVEPLAGDSARWSGGPYREGLAAFFTQLNRNKRSLALDLKHEEGVAIARALAERADVVVENFRPGVAERLGVGYEALRARNPGLVYVAISGFGPDGPYAERPAYDPLLQGLSGMMPVQGGDGVPQMILGSVVDKCTGMTAAAAVTAALFARERRGGLGQRIDVPMLDAYAAYMLPEVLSPHSFPPIAEPTPDVRDAFRTWQTADGYAVGIVVLDGQFQGLCRALGREDLASDPRFATTPDRFAHMKELVAALDPEIRQWRTEEFVERCRKFGAPFGPVYGFEDFAADPQVAHNRTLFESEDPAGGRARYLSHPARYAATPASLRRHPPRLGEHADEILEEAGYPPDRIRALRERGVIR